LLVKVGTPIDEIAQTLNRDLNGKVLYSDAWGNDSSWLGLLFDAADKPMQFRINTIRSILTEEQAALWHETKERVIETSSLKRHRASSDAAILQKTYALLSLETSVDRSRS